MSERRKARARSGSAGVAAGREGVPQALLVGRLIEVWAPDGKNAVGAMSPFTVSRRWWLAEAGITSTADAQKLVRMGIPWSIEQLVHDDPAQVERARERLKAAGVTQRDIPRLRREAAALLEQARANSKVPR